MDAVCVCGTTVNLQTQHNLFISNIVVERDRYKCNEIDAYINKWSILPFTWEHKGRNNHKISHVRFSVHRLNGRWH